MGSRVKIGSMNVRGLSDPLKRCDVFDWLREKELSLICLQDVHFKTDLLKRYEDEWGGRVILNAHTSASRGVAILVKKGLDCEVEEMYRDEGGNILQVKVSLCEIDFVLITIYGPNKDNPDFYRNLKTKVNGNCELPTVICGD